MEGPAKTSSHEEGALERALRESASEHRGALKTLADDVCSTSSVHSLKRLALASRSSASLTAPSRLRTIHLPTPSTRRPPHLAGATQHCKRSNCPPARVRQLADTAHVDLSVSTSGQLTALQHLRNLRKLILYQSDEPELLVDKLSTALTHCPDTLQQVTISTEHLTNNANELSPCLRKKQCMSELRLISFEPIRSLSPLQLQSPSPPVRVSALSVHPGIIKNASTAAREALVELDLHIDDDEEEPSNFDLDFSTFVSLKLLTVSGGNGWLNGRQLLPLRHTLRYLELTSAAFPDGLFDLPWPSLETLVVIDANLSTLFSEVVKDCRKTLPKVSDVHLVDVWWSFESDDLSWRSFIYSLVSSGLKGIYAGDDGADTLRDIFLLGNSLSLQSLGVGLCNQPGAPPLFPDRELSRGVKRCFSIELVEINLNDEGLGQNHKRACDLINCISCLPRLKHIIIGFGPPSDLHSLESMLPVKQLRNRALRTICLQTEPDDRGDDEVVYAAMRIQKLLQVPVVAMESRIIEMNRFLPFALLRKLDEAADCDSLELLEVVA